MMAGCDDDGGAEAERQAVVQAMFAKLEADVQSVQAILNSVPASHRQASLDLARDFARLKKYRSMLNDSRGWVVK